MQVARITLATAILALAFAAGASAGEPKNEWPFNRPVSSETRAVAATPSAPVLGEDKSGAPFTHGSSEGTTVIVRSGDGFQWADAGVGAAAMLGVVAMLAGATILLRHGTRRSAAAS